jgi:hypothetical protein
MTSPTTISKIVQENLHAVFGEEDPQKRLSVLARLWVPSTESLFIDPLGLFHGHDAISGIISSLHAQYPGMIFSELGKMMLFGVFPQFQTSMHTAHPLLYY